MAWDNDSYKGCGVAILGVLLFIGGCYSWNKFREWGDERWTAIMLSEIDTTHFDVVHSEGGYILTVDKTFRGRKDSCIYFAHILEYIRGEDTDVSSNNFVMLDVCKKHSYWTQQKGDAPVLDTSKIAWDKYYKHDKLLESYLLRVVKPVFMITLFGEKYDVSSLIASNWYKVKDFSGQGYANSLINNKPIKIDDQRKYDLYKGLDEYYSENDTIPKPNDYTQGRIEYMDSEMGLNVFDMFTYTYVINGRKIILEFAYADQYYSDLNDEVDKRCFIFGKQGE